MKIFQRLPVFSGFVLGFLVLAVAWLGLFFLGLGRPTKGSIPLQESVETKQAALARMPSPKVVMIGGSNITFGVRSAELARAWHRPVMNFGINAGFGVDYSFHLAWPYLKRGDAVLLLYEYEAYAQAYDLDDVLADYVIATDPDYLRQQSLRQQLSYIFGISWKRLQRGLKSPPQRRSATDEMYPVRFFTPEGDYLGNTPDAPVPLPERKLNRERVLVEGLPPSKQSFERLRHWVERCRAEGISVAAGFPSLIDRTEYQAKSGQEVFAAIRKFYEAHHIPLLTTEQDELRPKEEFFDTPYHLLSPAAEARTRLIQDRAARVSWPPPLAE